MIENIVKSAKALLFTGALAVSGCLGYDRIPVENSAYQLERPVYGANETDIIQKALVFVSFDQSEEISTDNLTWVFEYRLMF